MNVVCLSDQFEIQELQQIILVQTFESVNKSKITHEKLLLFKV